MLVKVSLYLWNVNFKILKLRNRVSDWHMFACSLHVDLQAIKRAEISLVIHHCWKTSSLFWSVCLLRLQAETGGIDCQVLVSAQSRGLPPFIVSRTLACFMELSAGQDFCQALRGDALVRER